MKSLLAVACFIFSFATIGCSQKVNEKDIPDAVKNAFKNKFPDASGLKWEKENKNELEANFKMNNTDVSANFKLDGNWVETETTIPASELPAAVTNAVNRKYPGGVYGRTEKIEKPDAKILYEVNITVNGKKKELELNPDGSIVK
jgi:Putative beta-lactamase-inhibitor-like, PepSY-like